MTCVALTVALLWAGTAMAGDLTWNEAKTGKLGTSESETEAFVYDGDSIRVGQERIRLRSEAGPIDAPELRKARCPLELFRARAAKERLAAIMAPNDFSIDRRGKDRYGRTVAVIYSQGVDVGARLVREGHAKMWMSLRAKDRLTWCGPSS